MFYASDDQTGDGVIFWAAYFGNLYFCQKLLQLFSCCIKKRLPVPKWIVSRALIGACQNKGQIVIISDLVRYGADINYCGVCSETNQNNIERPDVADISHFSPLQASIRSGNLMCLVYLIRSGAVILHSKWKHWNILGQISRVSNILTKTVDFFLAVDLLFSVHENREYTIQISSTCINIQTILRTISDLENVNEIFFAFLLLGFLTKDIFEVFKTFGFQSNYLDRKKRNVVYLILWLYSEHPPAFQTQITQCLNFLLKEPCNPNNIASDGTFPLSLVCGKQNTNKHIVKMLLQAGADPNQRDIDGNTPLHLCIMSDISEEEKLTVISHLLNHGCDLNILDRIGKTYCQIFFERDKLFIHPSLLIKISQFPLHDCLMSMLDEQTKVEIVTNLVNNHGINVNMTNQNGETPILLATSEIVSKMLTENLIILGADVNICYNANTSIIQRLLLSKHANVSEVLSLFLETVNNIEHLNDDGDSCILSALKSEYSRTLEINLILEKINCEILGNKNKAGQNMSHLCSKCQAIDDDEALELCKIYLSISANVNEIDIFGKSQLDYAASCIRNRKRTLAFLLDNVHRVEIGSSFLVNLIERGNMSTELSNKLQEKQYYASLSQEDEFILHKLASTSPATISQIKEPIKLLCQAGCCINKRNCNGNSPLIIATRRKTVIIGLVVALIQEGADVNLQNIDGNTALHECIETVTADMILSKICTIFQQSRFNWSLRNRRGQTVFHLLVENDIINRPFTYTTIISSQSDNNITDFDDNTVLHKMVLLDENDRNVGTLIQKMFVLRGTLKPIDTEKKRSNGQTALNMAACYNKYSRIRTILILLNNGANPKTSDNFGHTPLLNAERYLEGHNFLTKFERIVRVLLLIIFNTPKDDNKLAEKVKELNCIVPKIVCNYNSRPEPVIIDVPQLPLEIKYNITNAYNRIYHIKFGTDDDFNVGSDVLNDRF